MVLINRRFPFVRYIFFELSSFTTAVHYYTMEINYIERNKGKGEN